MLGQGLDFPNLGDVPLIFWCVIGLILVVIGTVIYGAYTFYKNWIKDPE